MRKIKKKLKALFWKVWSNHCGDCEGYCLKKVDAKWTETGAQALLLFLLPPSSWQPY